MAQFLPGFISKFGATFGSVFSKLSLVVGRKWLSSLGIRFSNLRKLSTGTLRRDLSNGITISVRSELLSVEVFIPPLIVKEILHNLAESEESR